MADNYLERRFEEYNSAPRTAKRRSETPFEKKRVVFVTGGAAGIGGAIVRIFRSAGCLVAFCDIDEAKGRTLEAETKALFLPCDVENVVALENCLTQISEKWGKIDIIINNVGIGTFKPITEISVDDFDHILHVNLRSAFVTARYMALERERLKEVTYGRIINLCSTRYLMSEEGSEPYSASKGGIYSLTHSLALSLAKYRITVNAISPGWICTNEHEKLTPEDHSQHPSGRVGTPDDIARMCLFICREENNFINGENIVIDGGMTKKMIYV